MIDGTSIAVSINESRGGGWDGGRKRRRRNGTWNENRGTKAKDRGSTGFVARFLVVSHNKYIIYT